MFGLKDLLKEQMRDLYDAETHYGNMLPRLIRTATSPNLEHQLQIISGQTRENAQNLAHICDILGVPPSGVACQAMDGLLREAKDATHEWGDTATVNAALIASSQRIVHYEIAGFGTGREFASCLGEKEVTRILDAMLKQAIDNDKNLTRIAIGGWFTPGVNSDAANED